MASDYSWVAKSRVVLFAGDDSLGRAEALKAVLEASGAEEAETEAIQADGRDPDEWFATASTSPFFSDRRVMVVRSVGRVDPSKTWDVPVGKTHPAVKALAALPDSALLLMSHDDESGDEDRQRKIKASVTTWSKIVAAAGGKVLTINVDAAKTLALVQERAAQMGKKISRVAAMLLCEMVAGKPTLAVSELEKVALFVGDAPEIRESDVKKAVMPDAEYNVYRLGDAVIAGDSAQAVVQLRILFGQTSKISEQVISRVFPTLLGQFRLVWQARFCLDEGNDASNPSEGLTEWLPQRRLSDEPDWRFRKSIQAARKTTLPKLEACLAVLVEADAELKGQKPSLSPNDSVERMALLMCRICASKV